MDNLLFGVGFAASFYVAGIVLLISTLAAFGVRVRLPRYLQWLVYDEHSQTQIQKIRLAGAAVGAFIIGTLGLLVLVGVLR